MYSERYSEEELDNILLEYDKDIKNMAKYNKVAGMEVSDVEQELRMLLMKCLDYYKGDKNTKFRTYFLQACKYKIIRLREGDKLKALLTLDFIMQKDNEDKHDTFFIEITDDTAFTVPTRYLLDKAYVALEKLPYGRMVKLHYLDGYLVKEIAKEYQLSRTRVYQLIKQTIVEVRKMINSN